MKTKKLNCIRARLRQKLPKAGGLLVLFLAALLFLTPALADDSGVIPKASLGNKPEVTIRGNVVKDDSGAPTGFYELALCVRSPKRIVGPDPAEFANAIALGTPAASIPQAEVSEHDYAGIPTNADAATLGITQDDYTVTYYPFSAVSAVVNVNIDVLTAVNWDVEKVVYDDWDDTVGEYKKETADANLKKQYPRGVDVAANTDPAVWSPTDPDPFPIVTDAVNDKPDRLPVALDVEGDRSVFTAAAEVDSWYENTATSTKAAVISISAHAPDNKPVIFTETTPVAVIRFGYDLKRFPKGVVMANDTYNNEVDSNNEIIHTDDKITGENSAANADGFWVGLDRGTGHLLTNGKTPLTWLADTSMGAGGASFDYSDQVAADTESGQVVWTKISSKDTGGGPVDWSETEYYYYLGAKAPASDGTLLSNTADPDGSVEVYTSANTIETVDHIRIPETEGVKVLGNGTQENPEPITNTLDPNYDPAWTAKTPYSYYSNLLYLDGPAADRSLYLELVNDTTYRKPRGDGGGSITILYYDFTDQLIGAQIVKPGDVREAVNGYVERNFIAPELRASQYLDNGELPTNPTDLAKYEDLVNSLDREFTYRGSQYPYKLNGGDALKVPTGDNYPLTNKLDYVFYKRLNIINELRTPNAAAPTDRDKDRVDKYYTMAKVTDDPEAAKYPYTYGWAIIEDPANKNIEVAGEDWKVWKDSAKTEGTWTTFNTGELSGLEPTYTAKGYPTQAIPAGTTETQPGGMSAPLASPVNYDYETSTAGANGYLRFADFSDIDAMLKPGQNVLLVKAVYEPGTDLLTYANYTTVGGSLYTTRYSTDASTGNAVYSIQFQYQRANDMNGDWQGVRRTREPAVQTGYVYDINEFDDPTQNIDQDLNSNRAFLMKTAVENTEVIDVDVLSGGVIWRIDYVLVDLYGGLNVATGEQRSSGGELNLKTGFTYPTPADPNVDYLYNERFGTNSLIVDATITQLLTEATAIARGESTKTLDVYFTYDTVLDLNLRSDMDGTEFLMDYGDCAAYTQSLVDAIVAAYPDPTSSAAKLSGIFDKKGNVALTWHQLQRHIIMSRAGNTAGIFDGTSLMSDGTAAGFPWCRYDTCADDVSMSINGIGDLLTAIHMTQSLPTTDAGYKKAKDAIDALTGAQLNAYGFRIQADGVPYDYDPSISDADLKTAILTDLEAAVAALTPAAPAPAPDWSTVSWSDIQREIIKDNMGASAPATVNMWWQPADGKPYGTPPTPTTWENVLKYSYQEFVGIDMDGDGVPDDLDSDGVPDIKIPHAFEGFNATNVAKAVLDRMIKEDVEGQAAGDYANMGWLRKELDSNDEAVEFADADEFAAAWEAAVKVLATDGGYDTPDKLKTASWEEIQYALLTYGITGTAEYKTYTDIMAETGGTVTGGTLEGKPMYWNDGGQPTLKLEALLDALSQYVFRGNSTKLDNLLAKGISPINNELYLRKTDPLGRFDDVADFKKVASDAITALFISGSDPKFLGADGYTLTMEWEELQWLLLNYSTLGGGTKQPDKAEIDAAHTADPKVNDYWWKDGGSPSQAMDITNITDAITAALWVKEGIFAGALDKLTVQTLTDLGIWGDERGIPFPATMTDADAQQKLLDAVQKMPYTTVSISTKTEAELLLETQYTIFKGNYQPAGAIGGEYWWHSSRGPPIEDLESLLKAAWLYYIGDGAGTTVSRALDEMPAEAYFVNERLIGIAMRAAADGTRFPDDSNATFITQLANAMSVLESSGVSYDDAVSMTNYQLQYLLLNGVYKSDSAVKSEVIDTSGADPVDSYWWFKYHNDPSDPDLPQEIEVDPATWSSFISSVNAYMESMNGSSFTFSLDDDIIKDVLLLRANQDGEEIATGDFFTGRPGVKRDIIIDTMIAIARCGNGGDYIASSPYKVLKDLTWYEFQYAVINRDTLKAGGSMPSFAECVLDAWENDKWKFTSKEEDPDDDDREEIPVDPAKWNSFMQSVGAYFELYNGSAFTFSPLNDAVIKDDLLLRLDESGTLISAADFFKGDPDNTTDLILDVMGAVYGASNGADYIDPVTLAMVKPLTWYQFQYCLINRDSLSKVPDDATAKKECQKKYNWKYKTVTKPQKEEIPVDAATWNSFMQSVGAYFELYDGSAFTFSPLDDSVIKDKLLLRADEDGTLISAADFFKGDPDNTTDLILDVMGAVYGASNGADYIDPVTLAMVKPLTWYQFQYCLIHKDSLSKVPDDATAQKECEKKYGWKYKTKEETQTTTKEEIPVDPTTWNKFMTAVGDYFEIYDGSAFNFTPFNDAVLKDNLLLRADTDGTEISAADFFKGDPDNTSDIILDVMDAIYGASNGGDYIDQGTLALIKPLTWYQFQYCLIHKDSLSKVPDDETAKKECAEKYDWKYKKKEEQTQTTTKEEIPVDATTWSKFMQSVGDYFEIYDGSAFTFSLSDTVIKDNLLLRADTDGTEISAADFFKGDPDNTSDIILDVMDAIYGASNGADYIDQGTLALIKPLTWYQFQYCLIHYGSLSKVPDDETAKKECAEKYDWKYKTTSTTPQQPTTTKEEIPVDATTWNSFMQSVGDYFEIYDGSAFTFSLSDTVIKDNLLLRADTDGTEISAADFFKGDPDNTSDIILDVMDAIYGASNGADYIDQGTLALIKPLTWYQFQYCLIHYGSLSKVPDDETAKKECAEKYDWKYRTVTTRAALSSLEAPTEETPADKTPADTKDDERPGAFVEIRERPVLQEEEQAVLGFPTEDEEVATGETGTTTEETGTTTETEEGSTAWTFDWWPDEVIEIPAVTEESTAFLAIPEAA